MSDSVETYKVFSRFYDCYVGQFNADIDFYRSHCFPTDKILEVGCGTGRVLKSLLDSGCKLTGVDLSPEMLDKASEKCYSYIQSGDLNLINLDFNMHALPDRFDKILMTFYTFNYILERPVAFLKNINATLHDKGLLLMDLFYPNSLFDKSINGKWIEKEINAGEQTIWLRDCRTIHGDMEHRQQIFTIQKTEIKIETHRRYYSPSKLKSLLNLAGFRNVEFSYDYDFEHFRKTITENKLTAHYIVKAWK